MNNENGNGSVGPEKVFKAGGVHGSVWRNSRQGKNGSFESLSVSVTRRYKDRNNVWQNSNSFSAKELQDLRVVAQKAYEFLVCSDAVAEESGNAPEGEW